jgi:hypothetical protein
VRDVHGNAIGGVRTPPVDVPVATLTGEGFNLIGRTIPLSAETLNALYPSSEDYLRQFEEATWASVAAGFLLPDDVEELLSAAAAVDLGR